MRICIAFGLLFFVIKTYGQPNITFASGYSINGYKKPGSTATFNQVPFSVQWSPFGFKRIFLVKLDYLLPVKTTGVDRAYTSNLNLRPEITVRKTLQPYIFNLNAGARIPIHRYRGNYNFYLDALLGFVSQQNTRVKYDGYDKNNYEILNEDFSLRKTSVSFSVGLVYKYSLANQDNVLFMFHVQSPPLTSDSDHGYELSYGFVVPLQLTVGYNFSYKKIKIVK